MGMKKGDEEVERERERERAKGVCWGMFDFFDGYVGFAFFFC